MSKIQMKITTTIAETFDEFIVSKKSIGFSDKTIDTYIQHFRSIKNHVLTHIPIENLTKHDLDNIMSIFLGKMHFCGKMCI